MKWCRTLVLFDKDDVVKSADWQAIHSSYIRSIESVDFPEGSGTLTLRRKKKQADGQWNRNGVRYLRSRFLKHAAAVERWALEVKVEPGKKQEPPTLHLYPGMSEYREPITSKFGDFDLMMVTDEGMRVAIEWETGNISSSHRAMNKLAIGLQTGTIQAGILIVPSRALYAQLTDRVGNIGELSRYLEMWQTFGAAVERGLLAVTVIEHDSTTDDPDFPYLPTGKDGRAREGRSKRR